MPDSHICGEPGHIHAIPYGYYSCYDVPEKDTRRKEKENRVQHDAYQQMARVQVYNYVKPRLEKTDNATFTPDDVYVVWFSKVLQNWKALVSTTLPDGMYYEVTFDGVREKVYLDVYKKFENLEISVGTDIPERTT